jgi:hypothetical protein
MPSKDVSPQSYAHSFVPSTRKRKPIVTYQSPSSGIMDMNLLIRNTTLEFEAASAMGMASRNTVGLLPVSTPTSSPAPSPKVASETNANASGSSPQQPERNINTLFARPMTIPRAPRPLYHPLSRPIPAKPSVKSNASSTSLNSNSATLSTEPRRRSSSRTRRPAPKVRDTESVADSARAAGDKPSPKRKRVAAAARRKRTAAQQEADGDSAYPAAKRVRKAKEKAEAEVEGDTMPPPSTNDGSPTMGYSTRARKPRQSTDARGGSATSDGTGSVTRTTPVNGPVEEFWVPTKMG